MTLSININGGTLRITQAHYKSAIIEVLGPRGGSYAFFTLGEDDLMQIKRFFEDIVGR